MSTVTKPAPFGPDLRTALIAMVRKRVPESEVEDIVQRALAEAIESPHAPQDSESLRRWIFGVAKNKVVDYHRRAGRESFDLPDVAGTPAPHVEADLLRWAEKNLPTGDENKKTLDWMLREGEGEKLESIAEIREAPAAARSPAREPAAPALQGELAARGRAPRGARRDRQRRRALHREEGRAGADHPRGRRSARRADASPRARALREERMEALHRRARRGAAPRSGGRRPTRGAERAPGRGPSAEGAAALARPGAVAAAVAAAEHDAAEPEPLEQLRAARADGAGGKAGEAAAQDGTDLRADRVAADGQADVALRAIEDRPLPATDRETRAGGQRRAASSGAVQGNVTKEARPTKPAPSKKGSAGSFGGSSL